MRQVLTMDDVELCVWWSTDHEGHYPVGCASVVVAATEPEARAMLVDKLKEHGLTSRGQFHLTRLKLDTAHAVVLHDGDY